MELFLYLIFLDLDKIDVYRDKTARRKRPRLLQKLDYSQNRVARNWGCKKLRLAAARRLRNF